MPEWLVTTLIIVWLEAGLFSAWTPRYQHGDGLDYYWYRVILGWAWFIVSAVLLYHYAAPYVGGGG